MRSGSGGAVPDRRVDAVMPSAGGDAPYGGAGRLHDGPRGSDAGTPGSGMPGVSEPGGGTGRHAGPPADGAGTGGAGGRHVADGGTGLAGGSTGVPGAEAYAFRKRRQGDTSGARLAAREARAGMVRVVRGEWPLAVALLAGGLLVASVWRTLGPSVAGAGNPLEADVAVDGTLAALGALAGVVTAACVLLRPGRYPPRRTLVAIGFSAVASVVSWQVGDLLGTPHLRASGIVLIWPMVTSAGLFAGSLLPGLSRRLED